MIEEDSRRIVVAPKTLTSKEVTIAGVKLSEGDLIEVGYSRRVIVGTFIAYDRLLHALSLRLDDGSEMIIPYKNVKYIVVRRKANV